MLMRRDAALILRSSEPVGFCHVVSGLALRKLEISAHAGARRRPASGKAAGPAGRLAVAAIPRASAVPESLILHVLPRISGHLSPPWRADSNPAQLLEMASPSHC